jgi:hypothetical protein
MMSRGSLKSLAKQTELFERAARYHGRPRERMVALAEAELLYSHLHPEHYRALQTIRVASQLGRLAASRNTRIQQCESRLITLLMEIVLDALNLGDLQLKDRQRPSELIFTLWSLSFGARALMNSEVATRRSDVDNRLGVARDATELLLDALGWMPLSREWDYERTRERIREDLFADEWSKVQPKTKAAS